MQSRLFILDTCCFFVFTCVCLHNLRISLLLFVGSPSNVGLTPSVLTLRTHNSPGTVTVEYISFSGVATGWTGMDMSTPLLLEVAPEIDPDSRYRLALRARHVCPPHIF